MNGNGLFHSISWQLFERVNSLVCLLWLCKSSSQVKGIIVWVVFVLGFLFNASVETDAMMSRTPGLGFSF